MFEQDGGNSDLRCKRPSDVRPHAHELAGGRILAVLRGKEPDPDFAGLHEIGNLRVACLLCVGGRDVRKQSRRNERNRELPNPQIFLHAPARLSRSIAGRSPRALAVIGARGSLAMPGSISKV